MLSIDDRLNQIIRELIGSGITLEQAVEAFEGKYIVAAMSASRGNVTQASKTSRRTIPAILPARPPTPRDAAAAWRAKLLKRYHFPGIGQK